MSDFVGPPLFFVVNYDKYSFVNIVVFMTTYEFLWIDFKHIYLPMYNIFFIL